MNFLWIKSLPLLVLLSAAGCSNVSEQPAGNISPTSFIRPNSPEIVPTTLPAAQDLANTNPVSPDGNATAPAAVSVTQPPMILAPDIAPESAPSIQTAPEAQTGQTLPVAALLGTVNGKPIFVSDILNPIAGQLKAAADQSRTEDYFREQVIEIIGRQMQAKIDDILMLHSAEATLTSDDLKEVDGYVAQQKAKIVAQYQGSEDQANLELIAAGSSLDQTLQGIHDEAMVELYREKNIWPKVVVTRKQIFDYYQNHLEDYTQDANADLYTITYPVIRMWPLDPNDPTHTNHITNPTPAQIQEARNKALAYCRGLEDQIRQGANFGFLAEDNSVDYQAQNGGHFPNVVPGEFSDTIDKVIFSLPSNSMAPPLLISDDQNPRRDVVMIIKVGHVQPHAVVPFSVAQTPIIETLRDQEYNTLMNSYIQGLLSGASVSAENQMLGTAIDVAVSIYYK
jgi:PPIC-type PPIASE domain